MKNFFALMTVAVMAMSMSAATYGILVNDKMFYEAAPLGNKDYQNRDQYLASVSLQQGDKWCIYDETNKAKFVIAMESGDGSAKANFTEGEQFATCNVAGCYDFYIKLKWEDNSMWVQSGTDCSATGRDISGGGGSDPEPGPGGDEDANFYAIGWINGADHGESAYDVYEDDFLFVDGKLTINCTMGSYICIKDHMGNFYRSRKPTTIADTQVTFEWQNGWAGGEKWAIPEGINYIIIRSATFKGNIVLERVDKATYDAYQWGNKQGIDNTEVAEKAHKLIVDGQLLIIRGDKAFDATGREVR